MKRYMIVVAGGKGQRMGGLLPKQFQLLAGRPILMVTLERLYSLDKTLNIVLVLPHDHLGLWDELCLKYDFTVPIVVVEGGNTRFHSVKNGLDAIVDGDGTEDALVGVHDGVRPFVSQKVVDDAYIAAWNNGAAIPVIELNDSLRRIIGGEGASEAVPRDRYRLVQTPQVFRLSLLRRAYEQRFVENFTDDASVVEAMGEQVATVEGNRENIKLTTPFDMMIANAIFECSTLHPEI
ncbi:MAG: 2-C-methyl-D-erythritol 4-phosphate cytidylyltransferase [Bacteroidaceae bacterium]|nr:2-C-methyl-D-erythritol 4-phosphate cytidylyltransferase [Bacteroidaceae bacterium]